MKIGISVVLAWVVLIMLQLRMYDTEKRIKALEARAHYPETVHMSYDMNIEPEMMLLTNGQFAVYLKASKKDAEWDARQGQEQLFGREAGE